MKSFIAIFRARNKEYYRDKGSLSWAFILPILIITACAVAFSNPDQSVFSVGTVNQSSADSSEQDWLHQNFIKSHEYANFNSARKRIEHHQLDLLIDFQTNTYWTNPQSSRGAAAALLFNQQFKGFTAERFDGDAIRYVDWVIPGVLGMNLMFGALFGVGYVIVRYRRNGVLKRLKATPVSAFEFLSAQLVSRLVIVVGAAAIIFIGCDLVLDLIVVGSYFSLLLVTTIGALAMIAIGLLISSRTSNEELAGGLLNFATWPMLFLSEVWFPLDEAPQWMRSLAELMPLTHIVKANRAIMLDGASLADVSYHLVWLIAITLIAILAAARLFRWTKN